MKILKPHFTKKQIPNLTQNQINLNYLQRTLNIHNVPYTNIATSHINNKLNIINTNLYITENNNLYTLHKINTTHLIQLHTQLLKNKTYTQIRNFLLINKKILNTL